MRRKKYFTLSCMLACLSTVLSLPSATYAQQNSAADRAALSLRGRVLKAEVTDDGRSGVKLKLDLSLELTNTGQKPALLVKLFEREPAIVERYLLADAYDAQEGKYLYSMETYPSNSRGPAWDRLIKSLDKPSPSPGVIRTLSTNETLTLEVECWFYISKEPSGWPQRDKPWKEILQSSPIWFQVTLLTWDLNMEKPGSGGWDNPAFGNALRRRWRQFGDLQVQPLTSEPMPLDLSNVASNVTKKR